MSMVMLYVSHQVFVLCFVSMVMLYVSRQVVVVCHTKSSFYACVYGNVLCFVCVTPSLRSVLCVYGFVSMVMFNVVCVT